MKNKNYVLEVMNSNMSPEAQALALSVLTNSKDRKNPFMTANVKGTYEKKYGSHGQYTCISNCSDGQGADNSDTIFHAQLLTVALPMFENAGEQGIRCKDVANAYNEMFNPKYPIAYYDVRDTFYKLLHCDILDRRCEKEKIEIVVDGLRREIMADIPYYFLNM